MTASPAVYIDHLSHALGDEARTIEETEPKEGLFSDVAALRDAGFERHFICRDGTSAYDLARAAVEPIQEHLGDVGAIIYATCLPLNGNVGDPERFRETGDVKHLMDFPGSRLQAHLGLERAVVLGLNQQACTGMLGALRFARMALATEPDLGRALVVTADRFPRGARYEQTYNLISDGAAACVASLEPGGFRLLACHQVTNGAMCQASDDETVGSYFGYTVRVVKETLAKAGLTMADIAWVVAQNTNRKAWQILGRLLRCDLDRVYYPSLPDIGHTISSDNMINLQRLVAEGKVQPGERVLLYMAGFGLNWQCVVLERV